MNDNDPMLHHKCRKIADAGCQNGREIWLGELLEPIPDHPEEKFCLHIKTPYKSVVFGLDGHGGDAGAMAVMAQIIHGSPLNPHWLDSMEKYYRKRATGDSGD